MRAYILTSLLLFLSCRATTGLESFDLKERLKSMITDEDIELFNSVEGLWLADDLGQPVRATLEIPNEITNLKWVPDENVFFHLYTKDSSDSELIYVDDVETLKKSHFNFSRETKFITHGWKNSKNSKSCIFIKDAYLKYSDYNLVVVDWSKTAKKLTYSWAAAHVPEVGKYVAKLVDFLENQGMNLNKTTLVGHSLGAHVVGLAGHYASGIPNHIVGLDPAWPMFRIAKAGKTIFASDAKHVEIIHTNAGFIGFPSPIGEADFYPNGGSSQIGCFPDFGGICSHARSYEYFAESLISEKGFYAKKCENFEQLKSRSCTGDLGVMGGIKSDLFFTEIFYLDTFSRSPFAKGRQTVNKQFFFK